VTRPLTREDFAGTEGTAYRVEIPEAELELVLDKVEELPPSPRQGGSFRLVFRGPADQVLPQAIYPLRRGDEQFDLFLVPNAQDAVSTWYEAIFF